MNILDIIIVIPIIYGLLRGLFRGLIKELTGIIAIGAGIIAAKIWAVDFGNWIQTIISIQGKAALILAYVLIVLGAFLAIKLIGLIICKILKAVELGGFNRILGGVFGGGKWLLITAFLLLGFSLLDNQFNIVSPEVKEESKFYQTMINIASISQDKITQLNNNNNNET